MQKLRGGIRSILYGIWVAVGFVVIGIFMAVDVIRFYIDQVFHTRLMAPKVTDEEMEQLIAANLPIGSSRDAIFAFLDAHKIDHQEQPVRPVYWGLSGFQNFKLYLKEHPIKNEIRAEISNVGRSLMVNSNMSIIFTLDDQDRLVRYEVKTGHTGL